MNIALAYGYFRRDGNVFPTLQFRRYLAKETMDNNIGMVDNDDGRPTPPTYDPIIVPCDPK